MKMTINKNDTSVPLMHHGPTAHLQKTCTGALPLAGQGLLQSHYGFGERKTNTISAVLGLKLQLLHTVGDNMYNLR